MWVSRPWVCSRRWVGTDDLPWIFLIRLTRPLDFSSRARRTAVVTRFLDAKSIPMFRSVLVACTPSGCSRSCSLARTEIELLGTWTSGGYLAPGLHELGRHARACTLTFLRYAVVVAKPLPRKVVDHDKNGHRRVRRSHLPERSHQQQSEERCRKRAPRNDAGLRLQRLPATPSSSTCLAAW